MQGSSIRRRVSHLRLIVGRARLFAPSFGWPKAVQVALRDRRGASGEIVLTWPGFAAPFVLRAGGSDVLTFHQVIADNGYAMPFDLDAEPTVIVDAGANIGLSSVWYAQRFPRARILAIEPEPDNFAQLLRNVATYPNITPVRAALWPTSGEVRLSDPRTGSFGFRVEGPAAVEAAVVDGEGLVPAVSVPQLIAEHGLSTIDILKIDIEGAERPLFEGDTSWLESVEVIAIELHDRFEPGCRPAFDAATRDFVVREVRGDETFVRRAPVAK